jgi:hypothetical protein
MKYVWHVQPYKQQNRIHTGYWPGNLNERNHLEELGIDWWAIIQRIILAEYSPWQVITVAYLGILFGGGSTNSVEDRGQREQKFGGSSPLVRGSGSSCNLVQEISFHTVKFS